MAGSLNTVEIKAFIPAKDFQVSKSFYQALGFTLASDGHGVAYFYYGHCSFLLQDFYEQALAENFIMHLLVEDAEAWHAHITVGNLENRFPGVRVSDLCDQPWGMRDFTVHDPSGVLWRIGQNI
ncbi:MAG: glyoxalase [Thalassolituus maritimus]|uniref:VOC domain-containing protein n=1 Tax=Thalassolituus maritimus TaxID=484498 RepID=A0A1N7LSM9_9GAMM|nr:VOC family protein [Thalassolituus maritimus]TPD56062.1 MAG: glyoxalase [Thalassolituus maritimus]SIS76779.1 hypothetical protein SAMN05421686_104193 [Thalassolituus maritimus]